MPRKPDEDAGPRSTAIRFSLAGIVLYSVALVAAAGFGATRFDGRGAERGHASVSDIPDESEQSEHFRCRVGPWGELLVRDIRIERPTEMVAAAATGTEPETWTFRGMAPGDVRTLLAGNGLTAEQTTTAMAGDRARQVGADTVVVPGDDVILSLSPETRARLFGALRGRGVSTFIDAPCLFPRGSFDDACADRELHPNDVRVLRALAYRSEGATAVANYATLIRAVPTPERRTAMTRALSSISAALVRICVRPGADVDKIASYWGRMENVRLNDVRPLLESLADQPRGGTLGITYLLPPFARSRLYTFPVRRPGDPEMDCHWTTFNFSSVVPDDRFDDPAFAGRHLAEQYYAIDAPGLYGDVVALVDAKPSVQHSAVYLADDLVFTKYGLNERQPWMIAHIADMQAMYPGMRTVYFRRRTN